METHNQILSPVFVTYERLDTILGFTPSKPTLYRWMKKELFPQQLRVKGYNKLIWSRNDVLNWALAQVKPDDTLLSVDA